MSTEEAPAIPTQDLRPGHFSGRVGEVFMAYFGAPEPLPLVLKEVTPLKSVSPDFRSEPFSLLFESEHHILADAVVQLRNEAFGRSESLLMTLVGEGDSELFYEIVFG